MTHGKGRRIFPEVEVDGMPFGHLGSSRLRGSNYNSGTSGKRYKRWNLLQYFSGGAIPRDSQNAGQFNPVPNGQQHIESPATTSHHTQAPAATRNPFERSEYHMFRYNTPPNWRPSSSSAVPSGDTGHAGLQVYDTGNGACWYRATMPHHPNPPVCQRTADPQPSNFGSGPVNNAMDGDVSDDDSGEWNTVKWSTPPKPERGSSRRAAKRPVKPGLRPMPDLALVEKWATEVHQRLRLEPISAMSRIESLHTLVPRWTERQSKVTREKDLELEYRESELKKTRGEVQKWEEKFNTSQACEASAREEMDARAKRSKIEMQNQKEGFEARMREIQADFESRRKHAESEMTKMEQSHLAERATMTGQYQYKVSQLNQEITTLEMEKTDLVRQQKFHVAKIEQETNDKLAAAHEEARRQEEEIIRHMNEQMNEKIAFKNAEIASKVTEIASRDEEIRSRTNEIQRLTMRMASYSTTNYTAFPDHEFGSSFRNLSRMVINLCSKIPRQEKSKMDSKLDPHSFLTRRGGGKNWPRYLRHVCWTLLLERFFRYPLGHSGFGGDEQGHSTLLRDYQLFLGGDLARAGGLPTGQDANIARAWRFDAILKSVLGGQSAGPSPSWASMFDQGVDTASRNFQDVLRGLGGRQAEKIGLQEISAINRAAGMLALRIGSQRAHLSLDVCAYGDRAAELGDKFRSSTGAGGGAVFVDLMLQPCLSRLGDGHSDWKSLKVLVPGEFLPQE